MNFLGWTPQDLDLYELLKHFGIHGGLYNRVTYEIKLSPFNLKECEDFYKSNGVILSRYDIALSYMVLGGIPYYMGYVNPGLSLAQNIDNMFFKKNAGFTRKEIIEKLEIKDGGRLSSNLNALISSDFIIKYVPFGHGKREEHYKLTDPFCMFYLHFIWNQKKLSE